MALTGKKYSAVHNKTGSDKDKLKANFDEGHINTFTDLADNGTSPEFGALIYQIQEMQEELDYLRTEISNNKDKTGISSSQASAITANTAKTGITSQQATDISDNKTATSDNRNEVKNLSGLITTNTSDIKSQGNSVNLLTVNKLEVVPDFNSSNNQRLTCGVTQRLGMYSLSFTFRDIDKNGKLITKTGSIQLK